VQLTHRYSGGLAFTSAYTWGKAQGYQTGAQDGNLLFWSGPIRANYNLLDFDRKSNFEQTVTYELPAGKGHKYFHSGAAMYALGGWRVSAIISAVSGLPFTISASTVTPGTTTLANATGAYQVTHATAGGSYAKPAWFNTASFVAPTTGVQGNTNRNQFRGPAYLSDNISMFKVFPLYRERVNLEARFDAFNATNTPAFGLPGATVGSSTFGQITGTLGSGVGNVNGVGGPRVLQAAVKITF
jgi:hypothetical protein